MNKCQSSKNLDTKDETMPNSLRICWGIGIEDMKPMPPPKRWGNKFYDELNPTMDFEKNLYM